MTRTSLALLLLLPLAACRSAEPAPPPPGIAGTLATDVFHVPAGETVWVDGDLVLSASTAIVIDGRLVARDAAELGLQDAPHIQLASGLAIEIRGEVLGGRGADARHTRGGHGSDVVLSAPYVLLSGRVVGGAGGEGGRSLPGGNGGDALVNGELEVGGAADQAVLQSGAGGRGGYPGGDGGPSGSAGVSTPRDPSGSLADLRERARAAAERARGAAGR